MPVCLKHGVKWIYVTGTAVQQHSHTFFWVNWVKHRRVCFALLSWEMHKLYNHRPWNKSQLSQIDWSVLSTVVQLSRMIVQKIKFYQFERKVILPIRKLIYLHLRSLKVNNKQRWMIKVNITNYIVGIGYNKTVYWMCQ